MTRIVIDKPAHPLVGVVCPGCGSLFATGDEAVVRIDEHVHPRCAEQAEIDAVIGEDGSLLATLAGFVRRAPCCCDLTPGGAACPPCRARAYALRSNRRVSPALREELRLDEVEAEMRALGLGERRRVR